MAPEQDASQEGAPMSEEDLNPVDQKTSADAPGDGEKSEHQPVSDGDLHDPNKVGPASSPGAESLSGDPLDAATKAGLAGKPPAQGGPTAS